MAFSGVDELNDETLTFGHSRRLHCARAHIASPRPSFSRLRATEAPRTGHPCSTKDKNPPPPTVRLQRRLTDLLHDSEGLGAKGLTSSKVAHNQIAHIDVCVGSGVVSKLIIVWASSRKSNGRDQLFLELAIVLAMAAETLLGLNRRTLALQNPVPISCRGRTRYPSF